MIVTIVHVFYYVFQAQGLFEVDRKTSESQSTTCCHAGAYGIVNNFPIFKRIRIIFRIKRWTLYAINSETYDLNMSHEKVYWSRTG